MTKIFNKKALRAFAEKVKVPELVGQLFTEVESDIKTVAVFGINRAKEKLLTTALFDKQGCFAVAFTRKTGEAIAYELESGKFFKQRYIDEAFYGYGVAHINTSCINDFFQPDHDEKPLTTWVTRVYSYRAKLRIAQQKAKSERSCAYFKNLPPIPSNFKSWCRRDFSRIVFDTSDRHHGHCQYCGSDIEVAEKLVQGRTYKCPHCHHTFKALSAHGHAWLRQEGYSLFSELNGVPVIRHFLFTARKKSPYEDCTEQFRYEIYEYERDVLVNDAVWAYKPYMHTTIGGFEYWRDYKKYPNMYGTGDKMVYWYREKLYPYSDFSILSHKLQKIVKAECGNYYRWEEALTKDVKNLEMKNILSAAGYSDDLAYGAFNHYEDPDNHKYPITSSSIVSYGRNPKEILRLDGNIAKLFKDQQFTWRELLYYNLFRETNERNSPQAFVKSLSFSDEKADKGVYEKYTKALKLTNATVAQVDKYFREYCNSFVFDLWYDYVVHYHDAAEFAEKPLIGKSWVFPPLKDIQTKHDEAVKWYQLEYEAKTKREREQKEKMLEQFVSGLASLDNYEIDGMIAKIPHSYGDFVEEGTNQDNCVGRGWYFERMVNAESIIVFLRTKDGKSYCTCQFNLQGDKVTLSQCRIKSNKEAPSDVKQAAVRYGRLLEKQLMLNHAAA